MHASQTPVHFTANLALSTRREFAGTVGAKGGVPARIALVRDGAALALEAHVAAESDAAAGCATVPLFARLLGFLGVTTHGVLLVYRNESLNGSTLLACRGVPFQKIRVELDSFWRARRNSLR